MGIYTYRASGLLMSFIRRHIGLRLRVTGGENIVDRPTLFVVNHFTRFETLIVPYAIFLETKKQVRTLAHHGLFSGLLGRYLTACGVLSTRAEDRDRTIVRDLMTHSHSWVIYPEGGLVKNRQVTGNGGGLALDLPHRQGPPHTGAAILAMKAELVKDVYRRACERAKVERRKAIEKRYGLVDPDLLCTDGTVVTPVTITYHPMRADRETLTRILEKLRGPLGERMEEELRVEGTLLFNDTEMNVHFEKPIEVSSFLQGPTGVARNIASKLTHTEPEELMLRRGAKRLTDRFMRAIYNNTEVSIDHLVCYVVRNFRGDRVSSKSLRRMIYAGATELCRRPDVRLHPSLRNGITPLVTDDEYPPFDRAMRLLTNEGVVTRDGDGYLIDRELASSSAPFQRIRLEAMSRVVANELRPLVSVTNVLDRVMRASEVKLTKRLPQIVVARDTDEYLENCPSATGEIVERSGAPFMLPGKGSSVGVILVHGYLASPEEMRPLAEHLNAFGHSVYAVRLDGHGTSPEHLSDANWQEWMGSLLKAYAAMHHRCDRVVVGGLSLGAVLSLRFAALKSDSIHGVFAINAPMKVRDPRFSFVPLLAPLDRFLRATRLTREQIHVTNNGTESPDINYNVNYLRGTQELRRAIRACKATLERVTAPALIIQSEEDPVVRPASAQMIIERIASERKRLLRLPSDRHIVVRGDEGPPLAALVSEFIESISTTTRSTGG